MAIVALAADKDAQGFVAELGGRASTIVFTELPGSSRGRPLAGLKAIATSLGLTSEVEPDASRALERGLEPLGPGERLAPRHRLALSRWGVAPGDRRGGEGPGDPRPSAVFELVEVNHTGMRERELLQRAPTRGQALEFCLG